VISVRVYIRVSAGRYMSIGVSNIFRKKADVFVLVFLGKHRS
jgi:hypothetical protein